MKRNILLHLVVAATATAFVACGGSGDAPAKPAAKAAPVAPAPAAKPAAKAMSTDYAEAAVTGGGSIAGTVTLVGEAPDPQFLEITKNPEVCGGEKEIYTVKTGNGGELAEAVVWIDDIASGKAFDSRDGAVDQKECMYEPHVSSMGYGGKLMIGNSDAVLHNIHGKYNGESIFNIGQAPNGSAIPKKIKKAGPVELVCDVHAWMKGWVFVSPHPYYAITDSMGAFSLGDVPPGTYTVKTWHEELGEMEASVTVDAGGAVTHDVAFSG